MSDFARRTFLKQVALGAGAAALYQLGQPLPILANFAEFPPMVFWQGSILDISGDVLTVKGGAVTFDGVSAVPFGDSNETIHTIHLDKNTSIWKGNEVTVAEVQKNDFLYGRGFAREDGSILGQRLWVNLVQYRGTVIEVNQDEVKLEITENGAKSIVVVLYDESTDINNNEGGRENISVGKYMQALGVLQNDGRLKSTRLWV